MKNVKIVIKVVVNALVKKMMIVLNVKEEKYYIMDNVINIALQEPSKKQQVDAVNEELNA